MSRDTHRLGRGLAALLGDAAPHGSGTEIRDVPLDLLDPNPHQPRGSIEASSLAELTASVRSQGLLQPLLVRRNDASPARYEIVAGERRWRAAAEAGLQFVPCLVQTMDDQQSAAAALVENLQRLDLNAIEEAQGYHRLTTRFQATQENIAEVVGKSRSHVANTLRLLRLPEPVQALVRTGRLSAGHARALLSHPDPERAAGQIVAQGLSVRQAEALVERPVEPPSSKPALANDLDCDALERDLAEQLGLSVTLRARGGRGSLTLRFSHLEQLDMLLARLGRKGTFAGPGHPPDLP